jgi:hypothetical protein
MAESNKLVPVLVMVEPGEVKNLEPILESLQKAGLRDGEVTAKRFGIIRGHVPQDRMDKLRLKGVKEVVPEGAKYTASS